MNSICFSILFSLIYLLLIFIEHQPQRSREIYPEGNYYSHDTTSDTNYYCGPKQISYYQTARYKNVNSIAITEPHKKFLPKMYMIGEKWMTKVALILVYLSPTYNIF